MASHASVVLGGIIALAALGTGLASAQSPSGGSPASGSVGTSSFAAAKPFEKKEEVRRDAAGLKGISPIQEGLARGDALVIARDYDGAVREYQAVIAADTKSPEGHLRVAEVDLIRGKHAEALEALGTAERFSAGASEDVKLRILILRGNVLEAAGNLGAALELWTNLEKSFAVPSEKPSALRTALQPVPGERRKMVEARMAALKAASVVRGRVEQQESAAATPAK